MKRMTIAAAAGALCIALLGACAHLRTPAESYEATSSGFGGDVTVAISVVDGKIAEIAAIGAGETPALGGAAIEKYNATIFKGYQGKAIAELDLNALDAVSGASYTSVAVRNAAKAAQKKALGIATERKPVSDSVAVYQTLGRSLTQKMSVEVALKDNAIAAVAVKDSGETPAILKSAADLMIPRILETQSLAVDSITGATASSNGIKSAIAAAIDAAGGDSAEWYAPVGKRSGTVKLEGYDVIVVGLGGSGMTAYVSAAENGATVFGLDSAGKVGGTSTNVTGPMAINPPNKMKAENGGKKWLEEEDLIQDWLAYTRGDAKEELVRRFVYESGKTMDWLVSEHGFGFTSLMAFFHPKRWVVWAAYKGDKDAMYDAAMASAKAKNPKNDFKLELTGTDLIVKDGKVVGVEADYVDGTTYEIYGDSVILATGGFIGNAEMKEKYLGGNYSVEGMMQDNGAGIRMATAIGAATYNIDMPPMVHIAQTQTLIRNDDLDAAGKAVLTSLVLKPDAMIADANGKRYMNEAGIIAFDNWKGGPVYYSIYSQAQIDGYKKDGMAIAPNPMFMGQGGKVEPNAPIAAMDKILAVGQKYGIVVKGATMKELADKLGAPQLAAEADKYTSVAKGAPDPLGKKAELFSALDVGPFYAVKGAGYTYGTCGGLDIDENLNVLRTDGTAIANLFAVGQDSMGVLFTKEDAYVTYGGAAQGWVLTSGRLAGARAASLFK